MLPSLCFRRGGCGAQIRWHQPKPFGKAPITDHERLIPLIKHLVNLSHKRHEYPHCLDDPPGHAGELNLPPKLARKPGDQVARTAWCSTRKHPWSAIHIGFSTAQGK